VESAAPTWPARAGRLIQIDRPGPRHTHWVRLHLIDGARVADARARLDAIALSSGPVDVTQAAYGGLAYATGLASLLYRGRDGRQARKRLAEVAKGGQSDAALGDVIEPGAQQTVTDSAGEAAARRHAGRGERGVGRSRARSDRRRARRERRSRAGRRAGSERGRGARSRARREPRTSHAAAHAGGHAGGAGGHGH
jgi:hypothetical protein